MFAFLFSNINAQKISDFKFVTITGDTLSTEYLKGKIVYINVFQTYCGPCIAEIPALNRLKEQHKNILFIALTSATKGKALRFQKKYQFKFPVISDAKDFAKRMNIRLVPAHLFVDREGVICTKNMSAKAPENYSTMTIDERKTLIQNLTYNHLDSIMTKYENE